MKSKLELYALSVCFASVVCLVISIGIAGYSICEILLPNLTMSSYTYERYQSNDAYWDQQPKCRNKEENAPTKPSDEVLTKQRQEALHIATQSEKRGGFQSLLKCMMFILSASIALFIHWKIAQRARTV